jgi:hypothetical protein
MHLDRKRYKFEIWGGVGGSRVLSQVENDRGSASIQVTRVTPMSHGQTPQGNWSCRILFGQHIWHMPLFAADSQRLLQSKQEIDEAKD